MQLFNTYPTASGRSSASTDLDAADSGPRTKRRKLDPTPPVPGNTSPSTDSTRWVILQAACRCLDLLGSSEQSEQTRSNYSTSAWNSSWDERASLFGALLDFSSSVIDTTLAPGNISVLSSTISTVIAFWTIGSANSRTLPDDPRRTFSSQCLVPTLGLLEILHGLELEMTMLRPVIRDLERLITVHVVLPGRTIFLERYAKKWTAINDVLFYDNLKNFLNDFHLAIIYWASTKTQMQKSTGAVNNTSSLRLIFDIAARAIPSSDLQKRQSEQPWLDALFITLAHTIWEGMPQILPSGVENTTASSLLDPSSHQAALTTLEGLVDVALTRKVRLSLPVLGYTITSLLVSDDQPPAWGLLSKLVQLDVNILVSNAGLSVSGDILSRVCVKIEATTVPDDVYQKILKDIIIPVMQGFARSRNIDGFIRIWQQGLENAIRQRYSVQAEPGSIPAVLVWDHDDIFDEFKTLIEVYAPLSLAKKLLEQTLQSVKELSTKTGSTAVEFSNLAIFTAFLNAPDTRSDTLMVLENHLPELVQSTMAGLQRKSDFQAQRWRLWSFLRTLLRRTPGNDAFENLDQLLRHAGGDASLQSVSLIKEDSHRHVRAARYLEALECFSVVIEAAYAAPKFHSLLHGELQYLAKLLKNYSKDGDSPEVQWDGRCYSCDNTSNLVAACIGRLLEKPEVFSSDAKIFSELVSEAFTFLKGSSSVQVESTRSLGGLLQALLLMDEVWNNPVLRDVISTHLIGSHTSPSNAISTNLFLLRCFPVQALKRSHIKRFAAGILQTLSDRDIAAESDHINDRVATILHLDTHSPGSVIDAQDWQLWVQASQNIPDPSKVMSSSHIVTTNTFLKILRRLWARALASQKSPILSEIASWVTDSIESGKRLGFLGSPHLSLRAFFAHVATTQDSVEGYLSKKKVQKLRAKFMQILKGSLAAALRDRQGGSLLEVRLILYTLLDICDPPVACELLREIPDFESMIRQRQGGVASTEADPLDSRLQLSIQRAYHQIASSPVLELDHAGMKVAYETLASRLRAEECSAEDMGTITTQLDLVIRTLGPRTKALTVEYFRTENSLNFSPILGPVATAVVASQVDSLEMEQHQPLANELAAIACSFPDHARVSMASMLLALDNCKFILEFHPSVVNQSTLDQLLAAICALTTSTNKSVDESNNASSPAAADMYARICEVLGVVLGRHRRRISDRYHLLVPAMSCLLRCLFWPGTNMIQRSSGRDVAHTINMFGQALPGWLTSSEEALPSTSADQLARLLSSICNPTVSAARTSRKRGHNELNDETKRARQLAGQHMLYLITEYARCSLDGQIDPLVKEHLMPGLYSVMDAIDKELMRALNSGMDPSSRAIFKVLYDSWTAHGKWDKS